MRTPGRLPGAARGAGGPEWRSRKDLLDGGHPRSRAGPVASRRVDGGGLLRAAQRRPAHRGRRPPPRAHRRRVARALVPPCGGQPTSRRSKACLTSDTGASSSVNTGSGPYVIASSSVSGRASIDPVAARSRRVRPTFRSRTRPELTSRPASLVRQCSRRARREASPEPSGVRCARGWLRCSRRRRRTWR
jgi:hypothetical protein